MFVEKSGRTNALPLDMKSTLLRYEIVQHRRRISDYAERARNGFLDGESAFVAAIEQDNMQFCESAMKLFAHVAISFMKTDLR